MKIAYFGLGKMGLPPALLLLKAGYDVHTAIHYNTHGPEQLRCKGGIIDRTVADAVKNAKIIFTIVPDDTALIDLVLQESFMQALCPGAILVDMTSCSAKAIRSVEAAVRPMGVHVLDAPVSGGVKAAQNGTMTMMCAGEQSTFEEVKMALQVIGGNIFYVGTSVGDGKKIKSINNLLSAIGKTAVGEIARIVEEQHLNPDVVFDVISHSSGNSVAFQTAWPVIQTGDYKATFTVAHMRKDVNLAQGLAGDLVLPLTEATAKYFEAARIYDKEDNCAVAKVVWRK